MSEASVSSAPSQTTRRLRRLIQAGLLCIPMLLLTGLMVMGQAGETNPLYLLSLVIVYLFLNGLFFLMVYTGKTYVYRTVFFVAIAIGLIIFFFIHVTETRGSIIVTEANMLAGEVPFCHLVIPMVIVPALFTRTIIFPGSLLTGFASIAGMIVIWIGATLVLGRGWCSWACFYGGLDDGFSHVLRKPRIKHINPRWTYLPYAVLAGIVLTSALTLSPTYCEWLCPFKTVTEFGEINSWLAVIQTVIFVSLFMGLVVVLPILTRRRIQCGLFCPFGAMQSFLNKINVFEVRIDRNKCVDCGRCIRTCPTFSLDEESVQQGRTRITCTKCGQCVDSCPKSAISFHIKGTRVGVRPGLARMLFIYPAFLFGATLGMGMMAFALWRILKLLTTGSVF